MMTINFTYILRKLRKQLSREKFKNKTDNTAFDI